MSHRVRLRRIAPTQRIHVRGTPRIHVGFRITTSVYATVCALAEIRGLSVSALLEEAVWQFLERFQVLNSWPKLFNSIQLSQNSIHQIIALAGLSKFAKQTRKGQTVDDKNERQRRRTLMSNYCMRSLDQLHEIAKSEKIAQENLTRATVFAVMARVAATNELILRDAASEQIFEEVERLREDNRKYEEASRELEQRVEAKIAAAERDSGKSH